MNKTVLAIDYGEKHVGLALYTQSTGIDPLDGFSFRDRFEFERRISKMIKEYQVQVVVVGDLGVSDQPQQLTSTLQKLTKKLDVEVVSITEYLSSFQAEKEVLDHGGKLKGTGSHSHAAVNILKEYSETKKNEA